MTSGSGLVGTRSSRRPRAPARGQQAVRVDDRGRRPRPRGATPPRCSRCSAPTARARPPRSRCARASSGPTAGTIEILGLDPIADNAQVRERIGVMLQGGGAYPAARAGEMLNLVAAYSRRPAGPAVADGHARPHRGGPHDIPPAVRRAAAAAGAGVRGGGPARTGVPRRADRRHGRARANRGVGVDRCAAPRRRDRRADHPPADRGRGAGRPDRHHRPRCRGGQRHTRGADAQRRREPAAVQRAANARPVAADVRAARGLQGHRELHRANTWSRGTSIRRCWPP